LQSGSDAGLYTDKYCRKAAFQGKSCIPGHGWESESIHVPVAVVSPYSKQGNKKEGNAKNTKSIITLKISL
jgi:hypothetical protein